MLGPALRAVKQTSPDARITLLSSRAGATAAPLLPWVDDVIPARTLWQDLGHLAFDPEREWEFVQLLRTRRFDAALIFTSFSQTPHVPGYLCYLAGIPLRAGEGKEFGGGTLSMELRGAPDDLHQVERNLRLIEALGFTVTDHDLEVEIAPAARAAAQGLLAQLGIDPAAPYLLFHPGASARARRYPPERSGVVARLLTAHGWPVLLTGVDREAELIATVAAAAPEAKVLVGGTSLAEYAALVERAALVICGNTLPLHLADALLTPVLVLYSGTDYESQWRPRRTPSRLLREPTPCHPCYLFQCPIGLPCLDIAPDAVVTAAEELLQSARRTSVSMSI
ncbi:MAG: glycosyltransferase family 9 protein [Herpetosiphonaceae bacterium]|nr:glycosyltransferase family 9 protein [Herpetosiphonaceae bacterium]